ncbi:hypothetical protein DERF_009683 [Dermatophagoides farinae]|uniref:Uncharacterized protein n=1 Tax=Dermatophagoides farinae TaxID=6954 RepID=A0A922HYH2_DERFA|nr:hypothetical protein DERF_009683 [Dermatophagoides farinae]
MDDDAQKQKNNDDNYGQPIMSSLVDQCQTINVENLQTIANSPRRAIQQQPLFFTRSTCSHTILNSPSSTCRLHVVSLNQRQSLNDETISSQNQNNNQPPLPPLQQQTHHTELSSTSLLSSPKSPCQISFGCNANNNNNNGHQIDSKTIRCLSYPNSYSLQSPTMLSMKTTTATSSTSRTSSIRSRSMQFFLTNNGGHSGGGGGENNSKSFHSIVGCCWCWSIDWLKFGFKLLLLFTILFWLFSIITWMSIMPRTMPISLTIITSMMTIGLIISLVIQSEWPYSFEFMPNSAVIVDNNNDDDDTSDDDDDDDDDDGNNIVSDTVNSIRSNCLRTKRLNNNKNGYYKNVVQNDDDDNDNDITIINDNKRICNHEESSDSGIGHSSIGHQQQQRKPQEITVIQIDNDHQHHRRH